MSLFYGEIAALLTAVCWSFNSIVFSQAGRKVGSSTVNHVRLWGAFALMILIKFFCGGFSVFFSFSRESYILLAASGIIGLVAGDSFLFEAFVQIGPRLSMLLMLLAPVFSGFLGWIFLGEHLSGAEILAVAVTVSGIGMVISAPGSGQKIRSRKFVFGIFLGILGAMGQSGGLLLSKMGMAQGISPLNANLIRVTGALMVLVPCYAITGKLAKDFKKMQNRRALTEIMSGSLMGPVIGVILSLVAITHAHLGVASTLMSLSPVMLLPVSRIMYKEQIGFRAVIGTLLAIAGAGMLFFV